MTTKTLITVLLLVGYIAALPALLWGLGDLKHIPGGVWRHAAQRPRAQWRTGMVSAYALGGWPAFVSVVLWRRSRERADLLDEWAHLSRRKRLSRLRAREAAPGDDKPRDEGPVIVLSEHEPEPALRAEPEREDA
jgi:hypothetical protein